MKLTDKIIQANWNRNKLLVKRLSGKRCRRIEYWTREHRRYSWRWQGQMPVWIRGDPTGRHVTLNQIIKKIR